MSTRLGSSTAGSTRAKPTSKTCLHSQQRRETARLNWKLQQWEKTKHKRPRRRSRHSLTPTFTCPTTEDVPAEFSLETISVFDIRLSDKENDESKWLGYLPTEPTHLAFKEVSFSDSHLTTQDFFTQVEEQIASIQQHIKEERRDSSAHKQQIKHQLLEAIAPRLRTNKSTVASALLHTWQGPADTALDTLQQFSGAAQFLLLLEGGRSCGLYVRHDASACFGKLFGASRLPVVLPESMVTRAFAFNSSIQLFEPVSLLDADAVEV